MAFPNANSNFNKLLIIIILIPLSSSDITQPRFLQFTNNYYYLENDTNITSNQTSTLKTIKEDPGSYLIVWFFIFFFMGLFIVCNMGKYKEIANRKDDVWKFMFFANNGIFVA